MEPEDESGPAQDVPDAPRPLPLWSGPAGAAGTVDPPRPVALRRSVDRPHEPAPPARRLVPAGLTALVLAVVVLVAVGRPDSGSEVVAGDRARVVSRTAGRDPSSARAGRTTTGVSAEWPLSALGTSTRTTMPPTTVADPSVPGEVTGGSSRGSSPSRPAPGTCGQVGGDTPDLWSPMPAPADARHYVDPSGNFAIDAEPHWMPAPNQPWSSPEDGLVVVSNQYLGRLRPLADYVEEQRAHFAEDTQQHTDMTSQIASAGGHRYGIVEYETPRTKTLGAARVRHHYFLSPTLALDVVTTFPVEGAATGFVRLTPYVLTAVPTTCTR